jgi:hypothetical protein
MRILFINARILEKLKVTRSAVNRRQPGNLIYTLLGMILCIDIGERPRAKGEKSGVHVTHRDWPLALYLLPVHKTIPCAVYITG